MLFLHRGPLGTQIAYHKDGWHIFGLEADEWLNSPSRATSFWNLTAQPLPVGRKRWKIGSKNIFLTLTACLSGSFTCDNGVCVSLRYESKVWDIVM